jgi:hypothetical protein
MRNSVFNGSVTFIMSEVLTSTHDCVSNIFADKLHASMQLAGCQVYNRCCNRRPNKRFPSGTLFCTKKSHRIYWDRPCPCKLSVKRGPASLKSLRVYKLYDRKCSSLKDSFVTLQLEIKNIIIMYCYYNSVGILKTQRFSQSDSLRHFEKSCTHLD